MRKDMVVRLGNKKITYFIGILLMSIIISSMQSIVVSAETVNTKTKQEIRAEKKALKKIEKAKKKAEKKELKEIKKIEKQRKKGKYKVTDQEQIIKDTLRIVLKLDFKDVEININEIDKSLNNINVIFTVSESLTKKMTLEGAQYEMYEVLKAFKEDQWINENINNISFEGYMDLIDKYGNEANQKVLMDRLDMEYINKFNFDSPIIIDSLFASDENKFTHPVLK